MALNIEWSEEAIDNLRNIIEYLQENWTIKELRTFSKKLDEQVELIRRKPATYKASKRLQGTRECVVTKHNTLFYVYDESTVFIAVLWDNRQNPNKLKEKKSK
jgi:plasmid stabilization system protein ParE